MRYKVIVTALSGRGKKIYRHPDIVKDTDFPPGHAEQLVKKGFLVSIDEPSQTQKISEVVKQVVSIDDKTKKELMAELDKKQIDYNPNDKKQVLYDLFINS